jgi:hypothetical protein
MNEIQPIRINIRNAGRIGKFEVKTFNKQHSGLIEKCLETPNYA